MKKLYYLILLLALILLFEPLTEYTIQEHHMGFYAPYLKEEEGTYSTLIPPSVEDGDKADVLKTLQELALEYELSLVMQSFDFRETLGRESQGNDLLVLYATGSTERLHQLPFVLEPTLEEFNQGDVLYSSSSDTPAEFRIKAPSDRFNLYLGNFNTYKGSLQSVTLTIMDSTPEKIDEFLVEVKLKTGLDYKKGIVAETLDRSKQSGFGFYLEKMKKAFGGRRLLNIAIVGLVMLLYYLQRKKSFSVQRLFGYSLVDLFLSFFKMMMVPSLILALVSFIPLMLYHRLRIGFFFKVLFAYLPIFGVFLLFQILIVLVMVLDQARSSPLKTLQEKKNAEVLLSFGFVFKILSLLFIFPILSMNLLNIGELADYYKDQKLSEELYKDVWILSSSDVQAGLSSIDENGQYLENPMQEEAASWLTVFYDEVRERYPVFWVEAMYASNPRSLNWAFLHVNGNFVRLMKLRDEKGNLLSVDNEEKLLLATEDRAEDLERYIRTERGRKELLSTSFRSINAPVVELSKPVTVLEKGSKVSSFQHVHVGKNQRLFGSLDSFSLGVNIRSFPYTLEELCFMGITETQREELLKDISHLRFSDQLVWKKYLDYQKEQQWFTKYYIRQALWNLTTTVFSVILLSGYIFYIAYDAFSRKWAVLYLFGNRYLHSSILLALILLIINLFAYALNGYFASGFSSSNSSRKVLAILMVTDLLFFGIMQLVYRKKTLKNLAMR